MLKSKVLLSLKSDSSDSECHSINSTRKTKATTKNWDEYLSLGQAMQSAMLEMGGQNYNPIQTADFCTCSGSSIDFFHSMGNGGDGRTLGMGWEGRGPGFNPDPSNIVLQGAEQLAATLVMAESLFPPDNNGVFE